jgi:hypothetical protein
MVAVALKFRRTSEFSTTLWHRRLRVMLRGPVPRQPGSAPAPQRLVFEPAPDRAPSPLAPVRIFLGTEPAQRRAERVFLYSIAKHRDPARRYEVYLMSELAGFDRSRWKTGFTNFRYAIPHLAGGRGRAIYNDVDQIYLADPAALFDTDLCGKGMLSITPRETSVMLLDCERMAAVWPLGDAQTITSHRHFRERVVAADLWGPLDAFWNSRDHEYRSGRTRLLHYTILHTQPWQPFPEELRYSPHALGELFFALEREADSVSFAPYGASAPV